MNLFFLFGRLGQWRRDARWRRELSRTGGVVGETLSIQAGAGFSIASGGKVTLGANVTLAGGAQVFVGPKGQLVIENHVFIGRNSMVICNEAVTIGAGTQIAHACTIIDSDHDFSRRDLPVRNQPAITRPVRIGAEVWIAAQAVILKGCTIGERAVVGAGAVVTQDVAAQAVVVGNPAKSR